MVVESKTKRIDGDTHFFYTIDHQDLKNLLPKTRLSQLDDMMWRDAERFADPNAAFIAAGRPNRVRSGASPAADPSRDPEARLVEMDRLGFDMQMLVTQHVMPSPLKPDSQKPLWLRTAMAQLFNNYAAELQNKYPSRFIPMMTIPWDDIPGSIKEMERAKKLGLRAVHIMGSYLGQNLDVLDLYPFWEAVSALDLTCMVHDATQPCDSLIIDHTTPYPMVGHERYHRLHIGTYLGFGLDFAVACTSLSLGGVLDEFPDLRFLFYEAGATWLLYAMLGADRSFFIERGCARTNNRPSDLIKRHCFTAIESLEPVEQIVAAYGSDNFFIGTDFPHPEFQWLPNATSDITDKAGLSDEDKRKILGGNLARVLKLEDGF